MPAWSELTVAQQDVAVEAARQCLARFGDRGIGTVQNMVAIAGAESGFDPQAAGDHYSNLSGQNRTLCQQSNCGGYCSFGLWQVFAPVHRATLVNLGAPDWLSDPCGVRSWLSNAANCGRAARAIYDYSGIGAWAAWQNGSYLPWLSVAVTAVVYAQGSPPEPPAPPPAPAGLLLLFLVGLGLIGGLYTFRR